MPEVDREPDLLGVGAGQVGEALDPRRRGTALVGGVGQPDVVDRGDHVGVG